MNINPFINLASAILSLYSLVLFLYILAQWLMIFRVKFMNRPLARRLVFTLSRLVDPALNKIRKHIRPINGIDISAIVLILGIHFLQDVLYTYFYK